MNFIPQLNRPDNKDKFYITKAKGGYSNAIEGKCKATGKPDPYLNTLANCVGYAYGRFHEIAGNKAMSYISPVNAEVFPEHTHGCKTGRIPQVGSIIVWQKGNTLNSSDGAGHVAIVEEILEENKKIRISQSGYNSQPFWTEVLTIGDGNWRASWMNNTYKFRCFIYNPKIDENTIIILKKGNSGIAVKQLQSDLNEINCTNLVCDGIFGDSTEKTLKAFQKQANLTVDGIAGPATYDAINKYLTKPENVEDIDILVDNKVYTVWGTTINNSIYMRLKDLTKCNLAKEVNWNNSKKMPSIKTK